MPRVSVIVPCFDSAPYVAETIASVMGQSFTDWQAVVVDDGSRDGSADVAAATARGDDRVRVVRQPNRGVSAARNAGFARTDRRSEYLLFLDADDCLEPSMLETMTSHLDGRPEVGMAYCRPTFIDEAGRPLDTTTHAWTPRYAPSRWWVVELSPDEPETPFVSIFSLAGIVPSVAVIRRSAYERTPGWDEAFGQHYEDTNLFLHLALIGAVHFVPSALVRHRRHPTQSTAATDKFVVQERKLYERWRRPVGLAASQSETVRAAWRFRQRRLVPAQALAAARRHARQREYLLSARFLAGAARRALGSFLFDR
jgi:glycosyltransferase involved in cell wall biosynthesis